MDEFLRQRLLLVLHFPLLIITLDLFINNLGKIVISLGLLLLISRGVVRVDSPIIVLLLILLLLLLVFLLLLLIIRLRDRHYT